MEALRGIIDKVGNKSNDDDKHSRSGPDASSAYRSSDASGEPDVGTKSYSRDKRGSHDDWDDRRKSVPDTSSSYSSRAGGDSGYSRGSSRGAASGLGSERSVTGNAGRNDNPNYSMTGGVGSSSNTTGSSSDNYSGMGRRHNTTKDSRHSAYDDNVDYSSNSSGTTGGHVRDDETGEMCRGRATRGERGHTSHSVGEGMSSGKHNHGRYGSASNNNDYS
ncbi:hypothetical protein KXD40_004869 [Peronospora effusa]|uniref:Uncharacterized protein n=1 Tax=Peronospora effusa TaxID=542832 RepID=A0A3M6VCP7_9STRA|nr:hypothetical protein DD238_007527 [Peronospora effusa]RQM16197.1 hypothetical protein DD237_006783 [Peronospora effusa]UIZ22552.1 hypothetical protein KXD40_004869 [Peronospora effusa]CAI5708678.1 unnamed protein product [Peronospora effusa]